MSAVVPVAPARLGLILTAILAVPVAIFFCFAAFNPAELAVPISAGSPVTLWYAYGLGLIVFSLILGLIYVVVANRASDSAKGFGAAVAALLLLTEPARAANTGGGPNVTAITLFMILVGITLVITWWAARRTRSVTDFYAAGGQMRALPNGLAIAGDLISAGAFLGLTGLVYGVGFDGLVYAAGYSVGYPVITMLFADRMRALGKFTFADILTSRLSPVPMRAFAATSTLCIVVFYLIAQMVGAGQLIELLFGVDYMYAECGVGLLMVCYVVFGGMMATTWVQIIKAVLMLISGGVIAVLSLRAFGWDYGALIAKAVAVHPKHESMLAPISFAAAPLSALSLGLAMFFGSAGLPHMIMRFFTVPDPRTARVSMMWASLFIGTFFALISVIGPGAVALVMGNSQYVSASGALIGGGNMAAVHLAHALGGDLLLGFVSAVAFATILAVVAGLTLAGASAVSHDLYANIICKGQADGRREVRVSKIATVVLGVIAVGLGIGFRNQNIAYLVALAISVAASSNFPLLLLAIYWRGLTTRGAVLGGSAGLVGSVALTVLGPAVWVKVLGYAAPIVALDPPTLITMPLAFIVAIGVSLLDHSSQAARDHADFDQQKGTNDMPVTA
ncbi:MAG: sodium:solute symporter family transporter [Janthinobacterium lividum]